MNQKNDMSDRSAIVVGASRGLGRGIATGLAGAGARVIAVARTESALAELAEGTPGIHPKIGDASDPAITAELLDRHDPRVVVMVAGATPAIRPLQQHT